MYADPSMGFESFFVLGGSEAHGDVWNIGQPEDIDQSTGLEWLPATAAHPENHLGFNLPHDRTILGPDDTALSMTSFQVQLNGDSNMTDLGLCYENQATSVDWNNSNTIRFQDVTNFPVAYSLSGFSDLEQPLTAVLHSAHTGLDAQTTEPSVAANHHLDRTEASSVKHATSEDWTKHRRLITNLYEKMPMPEVMRHMEQKKGFSAT